MDQKWLLFYSSNISPEKHSSLRGGMLELDVNSLKNKVN